jgi:hypothetical protein
MVGLVMHVMHRFLTRACAVAAVGVALGTWGVTAASASGGGVAIHHGALGPAGIVAGRGGALHLTRNGPAVGLSANAPIRNRDFAGYQTAVKAGSATVVATSYTLPALSCTTKTRAIIPDAAVAASNNRTTVALVITACVNGKARYFPGAITNGRGSVSSTSFAAGDVIDLTTKVSTTRTKVQVTDVTTGVTVKRRGVGASARVVWIGDDPAFDRSGARLGVPDFGKLTFKNCLIDGTAFGSLHPRAFERVNGRGTVEISTGGFFPGGTAFSTHFKNP